MLRLEFNEIYVGKYPATISLAYRKARIRRHKFYTIAFHVPI